MSKRRRSIETKSTEVTKAEIAADDAIDLTNSHDESFVDLPPMKPKVKSKSKTAIDSSKPNSKLARKQYLSVTQRFNADFDFVEEKPQEIKPELKKELTEEDCIEWNTRFAPATTNDLCLHPKKLNEFRGLVNEIISPNSQTRVLLLFGAPGSCKSAAVKAISAELGLSLLEFQFESGNQNNNNFHSEYAPAIDRNLYQQLGEFVNRASRYHSVPTKENRGPLISIDEFTISRSEYSSNSFNDSYSLSQSTQFNSFLTSLFHSSSPVILQITVYNECGEYEILEKFHSLLNSPQCKKLKFNPLAATYLHKGIHRILNELNLIQPPDQLFIDSLILNCRGDLRAAINALEFEWRTAPKNNMKNNINNMKNNIDNKLITNGINNNNKSSKSNKNNNEKKNDKNQQRIAAVDSFNPRDTIHSLFHGLGKIFYPSASSPDSSTTAAAAADSLGNIIESIDSTPDSLLEWIQSNWLPFIENRSASIQNHDFPMELITESLSESEVMINYFHSASFGDSGIEIPEEEKIGRRFVENSSRVFQSAMGINGLNGSNNSSGGGRFQWSGPESSKVHRIADERRRASRLVGEQLLTADSIRSAMTNDRIPMMATGIGIDRTDRAISSLLNCFTDYSRPAERRALAATSDSLLISIRRWCDANQAKINSIESKAADAEDEIQDFDD